MSGPRSIRDIGSAVTAAVESLQASGDKLGKVHTMVGDVVYGAMRGAGVERDPAMTWSRQATADIEAVRLAGKAYGEALQAMNDHLREAERYSR